MFMKTLNQEVKNLCFRLSKELIFKDRDSFCLSPSSDQPHLNTTVE